MKVYRIRNWDVHFEVSQSRRGEHKWVAIPNKHDGKGFRRLIRHERGLEFFGVWVLLVQIASKCPTRGLLADIDGPLTAEDFADKTGVNESLFTEALQLLIGPSIAWVEQCEFEVVSGENHSSLIPDCERGVDTGPDRTRQTKQPAAVWAAESFDGDDSGREKVKEIRSRKLELLCLDGVKNHDLKDDSQIVVLQGKLVTECPEIFKANEKCLWALLACAERSLEIGKKPAALFVTLIRGRQWPICDAAQIERAKKRLDDWKKNHPETPTE